MKLKIGDKVRDNNSVYKVMAIIFATVYLQAVDGEDNNYLCNIKDIYDDYRDIEII